MFISTRGDILSVEPLCISLSFSSNLPGTASSGDYFLLQWSREDTFAVQHTRTHKEK